MLIAALLELKSRLMLPGEEVEELDELAPGRGGRGAPGADAAVRALPRRAGAHLAERHEHGQSFLYRAPRRCPRRCARSRSTAPRRPTTRRCSAPRSAGCCATPRADRPLAHGDAARDASPSAWRVLRELLRRGAFSFDEAVKDADRVTVCVTVFALLELYKRGEAAWEQDEPFGADHGPRRDGGRRSGRPHEARRPLEALLFLAPEPVSVEELADALQTSEEAVAEARGRARGTTSTAAASCCGGSPAGSRSPRTRTPRRPRGACSPRPRTPVADPRAGRDAVDRRLPAARLAGPRSPASAASPRSPRPPRWSSAG